MDPPPQPQRRFTRAYNMASDTMSLVTAVCPNVFSQLDYQANPQCRMAAFLEAHHHVWVSRAPGRAYTNWRLNMSINNHWQRWAQLGALARWHASTIWCLHHRAHPVSALAAAMNRICTPPSSPISSTSPSPIIMRTPWQQAFYAEYGIEYDSDFEQGGGPFLPGCSHPWERSSDTSSSSSEWVFNHRDRTTPPPTPGLTIPPESPLRRRVTDVGRREVSPQLMARGPRNRQGNSTTANRHSCLHEFPRRSDFVAPVRPKATPKRPATKSRPTGKQYFQALRDRRSAARNQPKAQPKARQHAPKAPKAYRSRHNTKPPVEGKWVFIPTQRNLTRAEPRCPALNETAPPSYLVAQAAAVLMFMIFIAVLSVYTLEFAQHYMN